MNYDGILFGYILILISQLIQLMTKKKIKRSILDYKVLKDQHGAVGQPYKNGIEGGDSTSWTGIYDYFIQRKQQTWSYSKFFQVGFGAYVRHPVKNSLYNEFGWYYKNPYDGVISRDQEEGIKSGLYNEGKLWEKIKFILHASLRLFLFTYNTRQNGVNPNKASWKLPDVRGPNSWATDIRLFPLLAILLNPLLELFDLHLLVSTLIANKTSKDDLNNYLVRLHKARNISPTIVSIVCVKLLNKKHLKGRLFEYWCFWRKQPGMYRLLADVTDELK